MQRTNAILVRLLSLVVLPGTALGVLAPLAFAQHGVKDLTCRPRWSPTFGGLPGTGGAVESLASFDDGSGSALYAGGDFSSAGGFAAKGIARWNGSSWGALDDELTGEARVHAQVVFDGGSGPALFVGGFVTPGVAKTHLVAEWNGSSWRTLGV